MRRIFSGIQPTGNLTLGNYLGAIRNWVALQEEKTYECIFCVVDQHAITIPQDPAELKQATREVTASLIAAGIDPNGSILFNQSQVAEHVRLAWVLGCVARVGWLNRMTQFKDKAGKDRDNATTGLWWYPVLMAADILAYKGTHVPVGDDQKQHLELARDIAQAYNSMFGVEFFPLPEPQILGAATRVMSLRDGTKKMSKSDASDMSRINMTDDADTIANKIKKAKTDPEPLPSEAAGLAERAEARNLVTIYAALADRSVDDVLAEFGGQGFGKFKPALAELAVGVLGPIGAELQKLMAEPDHIDAILAKGGDRARTLAKPVVDEVYDTVGFLRP
ncbi:MAG: tryptophan--tRNA ligase [Thalassobaculaceae bacterium]